MINKTFYTIDSHTMGEPTRIVVSGFPSLKGKTMMNRKKYLEKHYDHFRRALMLEPRGHRDMFGAIVTQPVHEEADLGVIFMDSGGYLNMCGHGSIGTATVAVQTGMVEVKEPYTDIILDAPAGMVKSRVKVQNNKVVETSIENVPAFLYKENITVDIDGYDEICMDISFGGSFFALVNAEKLGLEIDVSNLHIFKDLGMKILKAVNEKVEIQHPYLDITTVDLVEFYGKSDKKEANMKNVVIFGDAQADRSPCGTGTSAKVAAMFAKKKIKLNEKFVYESITGSLFTGEAIRETTVGGYKAIIPRITGSAYIIGMNQIIIDESDPFKYGFLVE